MPAAPRRDAGPRLLFLASTKSEGGIERHSLEIAAGLAAQGVPLLYACPPGSFLDRWCGRRHIPTLPFSVQNSGDLVAAVRLARLIRSRRIDIVHAHSRRDYMVAVLGAALARLYSHQVFLVLHAHMVRPLGDPPRLAGRFFEWGADAVVAVSGAVCDRLRHDHDFSPQFVHLIYNGVDLDAFAFPGSLAAQAQREAARRRWGVGAETPVLGMVGRLDAKGQAALIRAASGLAAQYPALHVVFVGGEGWPGEQAKLAALAQKQGLAGRVLLVGPQENVPALLPGFDILVHLPRDESFGLALAEAMAAGLPTVATRIGGCREVVRDTVTGLLVSPGAREEVVQALRFLLDPADGLARRTAMGRAGRRIVEHEFSRTRQILRLRALYEALCPVPHL